MAELRGDATQERTPAFSGLWLGLFRPPPIALAQCFNILGRRDKPGDDIARDS